MEGLMGKGSILFLFSMLLAGGIYYMQKTDADSMMGGGGMMGGRGMMGNIEIPGNEPPQETDKTYVQGYKQAKTTCSQCHAIPDPGQHSRAEWPGVIKKMETYIRINNKVMPSAEGTKSILKYYTGKAAS